MMLLYPPHMVDSLGAVRGEHLGAARVLGRSDR